MQTYILVRKINNFAKSAKTIIREHIFCTVFLKFVYTSQYVHLILFGFI